MQVRIACTLAMLLVLVACQKADDHATASGTTTDEATGSRTSNNSAQSSGQLTWTLPERWSQETPTSPMRIGQASIPGTAGDGSLAIFFFGEDAGGTLEDNLQRWTDQVVPHSDTAARRHSFEAAGLKITWLEVAGTLKASGFGMGPRSDQPDNRLYGAVVEGPGGPWFLKATGPEAAMEPARAEFVELLESLRIETREAVEV